MRNRDRYESCLGARPGSILLCALALLLAGVASAQRVFVEPGDAHTVSGVGAGQGAAVVGESLLIYGDAETGVIREARLDDARRGEIVTTGRDILLTRDGVDLLPHPTGLTSRDGRLAFIGNTVAGEGEIFAIDLERALIDRDLDRAVINRVEDDLAVNGSRPEFVRFEGRWVIATSDYGPEGNEVRLYDPDRLLTAKRTSEAGVLLARYRCGPWVQNLHWIDSMGALVLVQNQIEGLRYRLTFVSLEDADRDLRDAPPIDLKTPRDELEGFVLLGDGRCALVSSARENNVWLGRLGVRFASPVESTAN